MTQGHAEHPQQQRRSRDRLERVVASLRVRPRPGPVRSVLERLARERER